MEFVKINKEASRKIAKKFDKKCTSQPYLQDQIVEYQNKIQFTVDPTKFYEEEEDAALLEIWNTFAKTKRQEPPHEIKDILGHLEVQQEDGQEKKELEKEIKRLVPLTRWKKFKLGYEKHSAIIELTLSTLLILGLPVYYCAPMLSSQKIIHILVAVVFPLSFLLGTRFGGNDICNLVGTAYGCQVFNMWQALLFGCVFDIVGAVTMGQNVAKTISVGVIKPLEFSNSPNLYAVCFPAVLVGSSLTSLIANIYGIPISVTQSVIFGLLAVGLCSIGPSAINQQGITKVIIGLLVSPIIGLIIALIVFWLIIVLIIKSKNSLNRAIYLQPIFAFFSIGVCIYFVVHVGFKVKLIWQKALISIIAGLAIAVSLSVYEFIKRKRALKKPQKNSIQPTDSQQASFTNSQEIPEEKILKKKEKHLDIEINKNSLQQINENTSDRLFKQRLNQAQAYFSPLLVLSAIIVAYAHGGNTVGNAIGPLFAVLSVSEKGIVQKKFDIPIWGLFFGGISFAVGIVLMGRRTIKTIGNSITSLDPMKSFSSEIGCAFSLMIGTLIGLPVSASQCLVGAVMGATLAEKISGRKIQFSKKMIIKIGISWILTIPISMFIASFFFYTLKGVVGGNLI